MSSIAAVRMDNRTYTITSEGYVPSYQYKKINCRAVELTHRKVLL